MKIPCIVFWEHMQPTRQGELLLGLLEEVYPQDYFSGIFSLPPCIEFIVDFFKKIYP
jgi:hypothetical protein